MGEFSLEGVSLVTLDVDKMYNNITADLGYIAVKKFLDSRNQQPDNSDSNLDDILTSYLIYFMYFHFMYLLFIIH